MENPRGAADRSLPRRVFDSIGIRRRRRSRRANQVQSRTTQGKIFGFDVVVDVVDTAMFFLCIFFLFACLFVCFCICLFVCLFVCLLACFVVIGKMVVMLMVVVVLL